jgi:hypothetical protein
MLSDEQKARKAEYNRRRYQDDPEIRAPQRAASARWRARHPERQREIARDWQRKQREAGKITPERQRKAEAVSALLAEQDGRCYLCERHLALEDAVLEHDHRCCPPSRYCGYCIRGAAHPNCNFAIGYLADDPGLLELVGRNLRAKLAETDARLASKPKQMAL